MAWYFKEKFLLVQKLILTLFLIPQGKRKSRELCPGMKFGNVIS